MSGSVVVVVVVVFLAHRSVVGVSEVGGAQAPSPDIWSFYEVKRSTLSDVPVFTVVFDGLLYGQLRGGHGQCDFPCEFA